MINRLRFNQCIKSRRLRRLALLLPGSSTDHILSLYWKTSLFLFVSHNLLMDWIRQIWLLNRAHILNLWYDLTVAHVLKHNLRIANNNWISNVNGITIYATVGVVGDVLGYLRLHTAATLFLVVVAITTTLNVTTHLHSVHWILWF